MSLCPVSCKLLLNNTTTSSVVRGHIIALVYPLQGDCSVISSSRKLPLSTLTEVCHVDVARDTSGSDDAPATPHTVDRFTVRDVPFGLSRLDVYYLQKAIVISQIMT